MMSWYIIKLLKNIIGVSATAIVIVLPAMFNLFPATVKFRKILYRDSLLINWLFINDYFPCYDLLISNHLQDVRPAGHQVEIKVSLSVKGRFLY